MFLNVNGNEVGIKTFDEGDIDIIMKFQDEVIDKLEDESIFVKETREECGFAINNGLVVGAYIRDILVGVWTLTAFGEREENYGYDLGFSKEKIARTINFENAIVKEDARGMGLDTAVVNFALEIMKDRGDYFACTVAPHNLPSLKAMVRNGFYIVMHKIKYGGFERYILLRDETVKREFDENQKVVISFEKTDEINKLLGDGYCVCDITKENDFVMYK
ncbi:MAG: GNAT family N-acetyltransferase [Oscillospiraceae bacterium]